MPNMNSPMALQYLLGDLGSRRALAMALRAREGDGGGGEMVSGRYVPNLRAAGGAIARGLFGDPLEKLRQEEQGALSAYNDELSGAMEGMLGAENVTDDAEFARRAARAQSAGVPQDYIKPVLERRQGWQMLNQVLSGLQGAPAQGVAAGGGAPAGSVRGAPPAGGPALPPAGGAAPGARNGVAQVLAPQGGGTPFSNFPTAHLLTAEAVLSPDHPGARLIKAELKARSITEGKDGTLYRGGEFIGKWIDGALVDANGNVVDVTGDMQAQRAGAKADAEEAARFLYRTIETKQGDQTRTVFAKDLPGAPGGGGFQSRPAATGGGGGFKFSFEGSPEDARKALDASMRDFQSRPAPTGGSGGSGGSGGFPLGTSMGDVERKAREADVANVAAGRAKLFEGQAAALDKGLTDARQAAEINLPAIQTARSLLDSGKVKTGLGANWALGFGRALSASGLSESDGVAATQAFMAQAAKRVMGVIKMLGSGSGISDADREYAAKAVGGNITMDEKSIRRILDIDERAQRAYITYHNKNVDRARSIFQTPDQEAFYRVEMPGSVQQAATGGTVLRFDAQGNQIK